MQQSITDYPINRVAQLLLRWPVNSARELRAWAWLPKARRLWQNGAMNDTMMIETL